MTDSPFERLIEGLNDPDRMFTRDQVAYLMGTAARWAREAVEEEPSPLSYAAGFAAGWKARVAEENAAYPRPVYGLGGQWADQAAHRRQHDATARRSRRGDYRGGPVPVWPETEVPSWQR